MLTPDHLPPHWPARTGLSLVELIRWPNAALWLVNRVAVLPGRPPVLSWARSRPGQADTFQEGDSTQQVTKSRPDKRRRQPTGLESILRDSSFAGSTSNVKKIFCEGLRQCFLVGNGTPVKWLRFVKYCNKRESYTSPTSVGLAFTSVKSFLSLLSLLYFLFSVSLSGESVYNVSSKRGTPVHKTLSKRRVSGTTILWGN